MVWKIIFKIITVHSLTINDEKLCKTRGKGSVNSRSRN